MNSEQFDELSKKFEQAAINVFQTMVGLDLQSEKLNSIKNIELTNLVLGEIDISGSLDSKEFKADMLIAMSKKSYLRVASKMLMEEYTEINDENDDVASELANMITGNAKAGASEAGIGLSMSSPKTSISETIDSLLTRPFESTRQFRLGSDEEVVYIITGLRA